MSLVSEIILRRNKIVNNYVPPAVVLEFAKALDESPSAFDAFCWGVTAGAVFLTLALIPAAVLYAGLKCCGVIP